MRYIFIIIEKNSNKKKRALYKRALKKLML